MENFFRINRFYGDYNAPCLPPKFCITVVFHFSWDDCNTREKFDTMVKQNFRGKS